MSMRKFKLITQIDRINYLSDNYISYYKNFFNDDEFYFMVHDVNSNIVKPYLQSHGFNESQMMDYNILRFGWGDNVRLQNQVKTKFIIEGFTVVYADIDERIFHPDLKNYIDKRLRKWIAPTGISLIEHPEDKALDENKKVLEQRIYCKLDTTSFSKICILASDYEWTPGRHNRPPLMQIDSNIYLVDIGKMCREFMLKNNDQSRNIYDKLMWRYSENNKDILSKVFQEHPGQFIKIPEAIKNSMLF